MLRSVIGLLTVALLSAGCGGAIAPDEIAKTIDAELQREYSKIGSSSTSCPTSLEAKAGASVACTVTIEQREYTVRATVDSVNSGDVTYVITADSIPENLR